MCFILFVLQEKIVLYKINIMLKYIAEFIEVYGSWYVDPSQMFDLENVNQFYDVVRDIAAITVEE